MASTSVYRSNLPSSLFLCQIRLFSTIVYYGINIICEVFLVFHISSNNVQLLSCFLFLFLFLSQFDSFIRDLKISCTDFTENILS